MRCSVSPFSRASAVCTLMQVAQPLIWEERIFTNSMRLGSRLDSTARDMLIQLFISDGAAAKRSSLAVMIQFPSVGVGFCLRHDASCLRDRDVSVSSVSSHVAGRYFEACRLGGRATREDGAAHALLVAKTTTRSCVPFLERDRHRRACLIPLLSSVEDDNRGHFSLSAFAVDVPDPSEPD